MYDNIKQKILDAKLYNEKSKKTSTWINKEDFITNHSLNGLVEEIKEKTKFLDDNNIDMSARMYVIFNDIHECPKCRVCGKPTKYHRSLKSFSVYCSKQCADLSPDKKEKARQNINPANLQKAKIIKNGSLKQSQKTLEKIKQTNITRYGCVNPMSNIDIRKKHKNNLLPRPKRGKDHHSHLKEFEDTLYNKTWCVDQHHNQQKTTHQISKELGIEDSNLSFVWKIMTKKHGMEIKRFSSSQPERHIAELLDSLGIKYEKNTRKIIAPYEIDFYLPDYNVAIEFDGMFWHSEQNGKDRNYHINKTKLCSDAGIRLVHIFESEWIYKRDIVVSRLKNILNKTDRRIFARKCEIRKLDIGTTRKFLLKTHIQGATNSPINYGLFYNDNLVGCMTFSKSRFTKDCEYELVRYSNDLNTIVVGGASKLLKHFIQTHNPKSIVSYSDKRWNTGSIYKILGFSYAHTSKPNYWYFNNDLTLESRVKYQKHKLKDILPDYYSGVSESKNMENNGYFKIYDCGNDVFKLWLYK